MVNPISVCCYGIYLAENAEKGFFEPSLLKLSGYFHITGRLSSGLDDQRFGIIHASGEKGKHFIKYFQLSF